MRELQQLLSEISVSPTQKEIKLDALIRAGELESALADAGSAAEKIGCTWPISAIEIKLRNCWPRPMPTRGKNQLTFD